MTEWVECELVEPEHGPPCGVGPAGHKWTLTIEQGQVLLGSGCDECDDAVLGPVGIEVLEMRPLGGRLQFEQDHPPGGCPYLFDICDHDHWWTFVPGADKAAGEGS